MKRILAIVFLALLLVSALFPISQADAGWRHRGCRGGSCGAPACYGGSCNTGGCYGGACDVGYKSAGYMPYGYPAMGYRTYPYMGY